VIEEFIGKDSCSFFFFFSSRFCFLFSSVPLGKEYEQFKPNDTFGRSLSHRAMYCATTASREEEYVSTINHHDCIPSLSSLISYNHAVLRSLFYSPSVLLQQVVRPLSTPTLSSSEPEGRVLMVGLGGGQLDEYLLDKFSSFLQIDHLELLPSIVRNAQQFFNLNEFICGIYELTKENNEDGSVAASSEDIDSFLFQRSSLFDQSTMIPVSVDEEGVTSAYHHPVYRYYQEKRKCFSNVVIADMTHYFQHLVSLKALSSSGFDAATTTVKERKTMSIPDQLTAYHSKTKKDASSHSTSLDLVYDYIFMDAYDSRVFFWDGSAFEGESNPTVYQSSDYNTFGLIKPLLRPTTGLVIFHFHKDRYFPHFIRQLAKEFGKSQLLILETSSNNGVVVATNGLYENWLETDNQKEPNTTSFKAGSVKHPCQYEDPIQFITETSELFKLFDIEDKNVVLYEYALNCVDFEKYFTLNDDNSEETKQ
jgi:hypothetical protein